LLLGAALGAIVLVDLNERRIPNRVVVPAAVACSLLSLAAGAGVLDLLPGFALVAVLHCTSLIRPEALGMGDVKLALLLVVGLDGDAPWALVTGLVLGALFGLLLIGRCGREARCRALPFAPFLATGALVALLT
jgi:leader peptidase (prepilin peptidase)/N-methyltransferase